MRRDDPDEGQQPSKCWALVAPILVVLTRPLAACAWSFDVVVVYFVVGLCMEHSEHGQGQRW